MVEQKYDRLSLDVITVTGAPIEEKQVEQKYRKHPELHKGIRIQYVDDSAVRSERIHSRHGNSITVINALKQKKRIKIEQVKGYWQPKVKARPENMIPL